MEAFAAKVKAAVAASDEAEAAMRRAVYAYREVEIESRNLGDSNGRFVSSRSVIVYEGRAYRAAEWSPGFGHHLVESILYVPPGAVV